MSSRVLLPAVLLSASLAVVAWTVKKSSLPPADFTFNNETEIESLDPAAVTGQPEGRILWAIYEGLIQLSADTRQPQPGVALRWDVSEDGKTYTFHLRKNAKWSNGDPVTSQDFIYSMRRFLDPMMATEYGYQAWYLKNAKKYSSGARALEIGDPVEVEFHERPEDALPHARGTVLRGRLKAVETDPTATAEQLADDARWSEHRWILVDIDGATRRFKITASPGAVKDGQAVRQVLLDFGEVGMSAPDDYTIVTELQAPTAYWLQLLGFYPLSPVHQKTVETYGKPAWMYPENLVTNGPYKVVLRRLRDRIRLQKNEHYWNRDNVAIETIDALAVESEVTAFNLYETGQVDWLPKAPPLMSRELLTADPPRPDLNPQPMFTSYYYNLNCTREPLTDVRIRRALTLAIDREEIVRTACAGEVPARALVPPGIPGYDSPLCPARDVDQARQLLAEAGYPEGAGFPKLEILYNSNDVHQLIAELVRKQWQRALGIDIAIRNEEWATYDSSLRQKKFDIARRAWGGDYLDPNTFLDMFLTGGENNDSGWSNPEFDELIEAAKYELDATARMKLLTRAEGIIMEDLPLIPIYFYVSRNLVHPKVHGLYNNVQDTHPLWALSIDPDATEANQYMAGSK